MTVVDARQRTRAIEPGASFCVSAPAGSGKTELLKQTIAGLGGSFAIGAIVGDVETENDALRLRESGAPAHQIQTHNMCHLEAFHIEKAICDAAQYFDTESLDLLVIENVIEGEFAQGARA